MAQAAVHSYAVVCFDSKEAQDRALADPLRYFGIAIEGEFYFYLPLHYTRIMLTI